MKVLFIYPNAGSQIGFNYGVAHLSGVLKHAGHEVELIHLCEDLAPLPTQEQFCAHVREINPDVVGFSVVTNQWQYTGELAGWVREATDAPLLCGGIHATVATKEVLASGLFDYVLLGECEDALLEVVERLADGKPLDDVRNVGYCRDGVQTINPMRALPDLTALPPKDYDIFDFQEMIDAKRGWVGLMASRGCPFSCTYCFNHAVVRMYRRDLQCTAKELGYIRYFPLEGVIAEIEDVQSRFENISMFIFDDDLFTYNRQYLLDFCEAYKRVSDLPFVVNGHVGFFDRERAEALASANCRIVKFGLESGSERVREQVLNRHTSNAQITDAIAMAHEAGLHSSVFLMIGLPNEEEEDLWDTVNLLAAARPGRFRWTFFFPFPGTKAYDISVEGGYIDFDAMKNMVNFTDRSCLRFGPEQDLLLRKIGKIMPWFVNARADWPAAEHYRARTDEILGMNEAEWEAAAPALLDEDKSISTAVQERDLSHYAVKYNRFMGVISDYFLNE